jgi:hypothetical protein
MKIVSHELDEGRSSRVKAMACCILEEEASITIRFVRTQKKKKKGSDLVL